MSTKISEFINNLQIVVSQSFVDWADRKFNSPDFRYELGRKGVDFELLEQYKLSNKIVDKKDTDNKYWPDYNIGKMRVDNKCITSTWFEIKETVEYAVKTKLITHFLFYHMYPKTSNVFKAGDVVKFEFIGFEEANKILAKKFKGKYSNVVDIKKYFN
tara:strand:+ start:1298 stop:1771 length:474 start_codon:yes stop_codon:yes gene_type:complete